MELPERTSSCRLTSSGTSPKFGDVKLFSRRSKTEKKDKRFHFTEQGDLAKAIGAHCKVVSKTRAAGIFSSWFLANDSDTSCGNAGFVADFAAKYK